MAVDAAWQNYCKTDLEITCFVIFDRQFWTKSNSRKAMTSRQQSISSKHDNSLISRKVWILLRTNKELTQNGSSQYSEKIGQIRLSDIFVIGVAKAWGYRGKVSIP